MTRKITRAEWIDAAHDRFRMGGVAEVRIEPLAQELGVSKGSFYWHFRDRVELLETILVRWESETEWLVAGALEAGSPRERIVRFFELAIVSPYPPDRQMFAWARADQDVGRRVITNERRRIGFLRDQLVEAGLESQVAQARAEAIYLASLGWLEWRWRGAEAGERLADFCRQLVADVLAAAQLAQEK